MSNTYNGWTNRETWLYGLWFDGDSDAELAQSIYNDAEANEYSTREQVAKYELTDALKRNFEEYIEQETQGNSGMIADLLSGAVSNINWYEIAASQIDALEIVTCAQCGKEILDDDAIYDKVHEQRSGAWCQECTDEADEADEQEDEELVNA